MKFSDVEDAIRRANDTRYGLGVSIRDLGGRRGMGAGVLEVAFDLGRRHPPGVEFLDARFLLDHFGAVHAEAALLRHHEVRAQTGREPCGFWLPECAYDPAFDTLVISGGNGPREDAFSPRLIAFVREAAAHSRRMTSVCSGAFALAAAGLLDGRRATTHWRMAALLQALFTKDGKGEPRKQLGDAPELAKLNNAILYGPADMVTPLITLGLIPANLGHRFNKSGSVKPFPGIKVTAVAAEHSSLIVHPNPATGKLESHPAARRKETKNCVETRSL